MLQSNPLANRETNSKYGKAGKPGEERLGAVHKVHRAIFGQFVPPLLLSHFVTHPGTPHKALMLQSNPLANRETRSKYGKSEKPGEVSCRLKAVHKVHHAIFGQFLPPSPVTLCHTSRDPHKVRHTSRTPTF